jgi:hypothetical protein
MLDRIQLRGRRMRTPTPALVVATTALFAALSGGALAAGIVPLARHAHTADSATMAQNAQHLNGQTASQLAALMRGPRGLPGIQGPAGTPGATGAVGPAGPAGPQGPKGDTGATGQQGPQGPQGDVGAGLKIVGTVAAVGDLPQSGTTGDAYLVGGDLYVWTGSKWTDAGPVLGPKGDKGDKGDTGATGPQGPRGLQGVPGTAAVSIHTLTYSLDGSDSRMFTVSCATGQKAVGGGFDSDGQVHSLDTTPTATDDGWKIYLFNPDKVSDSGTAYAVCLG